MALAELQQKYAVESEVGGHSILSHTPRRSMENDCDVCRDAGREQRDEKWEVRGILMRWGSRQRYNKDRHNMRSAAWL